MSKGFVSAVFFVPLELRPESDDELWSAIGVDREQFFGPLHVAEQRIDVLSDHVCAQLYFLFVSFADLVGKEPAEEIPLERDPALPLALALRAGAAAARAEVAILLTHETALDSLLERYWMVLVGDTTALLAERFGLLYLDEKLGRDLNAPPRLLEERDELPGGPGRAIFSQRGWARWF